MLAVKTSVWFHFYAGRVIQNRAVEFKPDCHVFLPKSAWKEYVPGQYIELAGSRFKVITVTQDAEPDLDGTHTQIIEIRLNARGDSRRRQLNSLRYQYDKLWAKLEELESEGELELDLWAGDPGF